MFNGWKITNIFEAPPCELDTVDGPYNKTGYQLEHRDDGFAITVGLQEYISGWSAWEVLYWLNEKQANQGDKIMTDDYWENTEPCTSIEQLQEEQAALVEDLVHKADLLRVATKALEDIRITCISSPYWHNQASHAPAHLQNVTRTLLRQHRIVTDAQKEIENKNRAILET